MLSTSKTSQPVKERDKKINSKKDGNQNFWIQESIFILYQVGITLYFIGFSLYRLIAHNLLKMDIPLKNQWLPLLLPKNHPSKKNPSLVWIHAVSGGEVKLANRIIKIFYSHQKVKTDKILLTYGSQTGKEIAEKINSDHPHLIHCYLPIDFFPLTNRWVSEINKHYKIKKFIVIEHDFWPNWLRAMKKVEVQRIGINYFLKTRDYFRYLFLPDVYHFVHDLDILITQNLQESEKVLNFHPHFKVITGQNLKYDLSQHQREHQEKLVNSPFPKSSNKINEITITLGSSHEGEEKIILVALAKYLKPTWSGVPRIRLVIIPRHPQRSDSIATLLKQFSNTDESLPYQFFPTPKKKNLSTKNIFVVTEMGWSEYFYQISDIVIIGDSFIPSQGGHNFLEPLAYGRCVIYGPNMVNYSDITPQFEKEGAVIRIPQENIQEKLSNTLEVLILDHNRRTNMGKLGLSLLQKNKFDQKVYQEILN